MPPKSIAVASDHAGFGLKKAVVRHLAEMGHEVRDLGTDGEESVDYPDFADKVTDRVLSGESGPGILICGSGIGMSIAANRRPGIRAALVHDVEAARLSRQHNDANILVLAGRMIEEDRALDCVDAFLSTEFEGGRHSRRVGKLA